MSDERTPQAAPPPHPSRKKLILGGIAIIAAIAVALVLSSGGEPSSEVGSAGGPTQTITGEIKISGDSDSVHVMGPIGGKIDSCAGVGPYDGFVQGFGVSVRDSEGNEIGAGSLDPGKPTGGPDSYTCTFPFDVPNLPQTDVYAVALTNEEELARFTAEELEEMGWEVEISVAP